MERDCSSELHKALLGKRSNPQGSFSSIGPVSLWTAKKSCQSCTDDNDGSTKADFLEKQGIVISLALRERECAALLLFAVHLCSSLPFASLPPATERTFT